MSSLKALIDFLKGKKTNLAAGAMILFAVLGVALKQMTLEQGMVLVLQAAAVAGLRNALP